MKSLIVLLTAAAAAATSASSDALLPFTYSPLPLGSIQPEGWLNDQLELMANGLAGNEYEFYMYVKNSSWLGGGSEYSDLDEGFPYWFNGLVPLAYGLNDPRLKSQVQDAANYVLDHQADDGWLGAEVGAGRILWARFPASLGFMQLAEAEPTMTDKIVTGLQNFAVLMNSMLKNNYTGYLGTDDDLWGRARFQDMIITLQWLYEKYPQNNSQILLENMNLLLDGGYDWATWYLDDFITGDVNDVSTIISNEYFQFEHGVNAGQALKSGAVIRRFTNNDTLLQSTRQGVSETFQYHGAPSGTILADERLEGLSPMAGSELCTTVETIYSLSYLFQALGDNDFADRSELAAFNALPAALTPDWWAHQYMTEPNQGYSEELTETPFWNVNTLGQTFGMEPNYPCCAVNHPQGYPKFLSNSWVQVGDNGLGHALLSPSTVKTTLAGNNQVSVTANTNYPFDLTLTYTISASEAFDFYVRVPGWITGATITGDSISQSKISPGQSNPLAKVSLPAGQTKLTYTLSANLITEQRVNNTISVHYGPLLYALQIGEQWTSQAARAWNTQEAYPAGYAPAQAQDHTISNQTAWNIAIDPSTLVYKTTSDPSAQLPNPVWTINGPPGEVTVRGCEIAWPISQGVPADPPADRTCTAPAATYTLIPYGAAKIHMAQLPTVSLTSS